MRAVEAQAITRALAGIEVPTIVEAGACDGQERLEFQAALGREFHHTMIEPDPRNCQQIIDRNILGDTSTFYSRVSMLVQGVPICKLIVGAVSDHCGFGLFHFSENALDGMHSSGSIANPTGHLRHAPHVTFPNVGCVPYWTLDEVYEREHLDIVDLLWTDVQGAEKPMLLGGAKMLANTRYLMMEVEHTEMYAGEALREELLRMLPAWVVYEDFGNNVMMHNQIL